MWLERFLSLIDSTAVGRLVARQADVLEATDPDRIYVENIRSFFGFPTPVARGLCELAVRRGLFLRRIGLLCPNEDCQRLVRSFAPDEVLPDELTCKTCEIDEKEVSTFPAGDMIKLEFYKLNDQ